MDIPDFEMVLVYGCPNSITQLYQVPVHSFSSLKFVVELFGCAGHNGSQSRGHLFNSVKEEFNEIRVKCFALNKEDCRRKLFWKEFGTIMKGLIFLD